MPQINTLASTYGERGLKVLGINLWQSQNIVLQYQNQYPNILMLKDTTGSVWNVYKIGGFIPLNYLLDHDFDQTVDFRQEGYTHNTIVNHINNLLSPVSVNLTLDSPSYHQGSSLGYTVDLKNWEAAAQSFYAIIDVKMLSGQYYPLYPTFALTMPANDTWSFHLVYPLPPGIPPVGSYQLRARLGKWPPAELLNMDFEPFEIIP